MITDNESNESNEKQVLLPKKTELSKKEALAKLINISLPYSISRLALVGGEFLQNAMLGKLDENELAARNLVIAYESFTLETAITMLFTFSVELSESIENEAEIPNIVQRGFALATLTSIPVMLGSTIGAEILSAFSQPNAIIKITREYFWVSIPYLPATLYIILQQQCAISLEKPLPVTIFVLSHSVLTTLLCFFFITGNHDLHEFGLAGLGISASLSSWINALGFAVYLKYMPSFSGYNLFSKLSFNFREQKTKLIESFNLAAPVAIATSVDKLASFLLTTMIGQKGEIDLAAKQLATLYCALLSIPIDCVAQSVSPLISKEVTNKSLSNAKSIHQVAIYSAILFCGLTLIIFYLIADHLTGPFIEQDDSESDEIKDIFKELLLIGGINELVSGFKMIGAGSLRGFKETQYPMKMTLLGAALQIGLGYTLNYTTQLGSVGLYVAQLVSNVIVTPPILYKLHQYFSGEIQVNNQPEELVNPVESTRFPIITRFYDSVSSCFKGSSTKDSNNANASYVSTSNSVNYSSK